MRDLSLLAREACGAEASAHIGMSCVGAGVGWLRLRFARDTADIIRSSSDVYVAIANGVDACAFVSAGPEPAPEPAIPVGYREPML